MVIINLIILGYILQVTNYCMCDILYMYTDTATIATNTPAMPHTPLSLHTPIIYGHTHSTPIQDDTLQLSKLSMNDTQLNDTPTHTHT